MNFILTIVLGANDGVINHEERRANIYIIGFLVGTIKRRKDCKIFDEMDHFRKKTWLVINSQQNLLGSNYKFVTFIFEF